MAHYLVKAVLNHETAGEKSLRGKGEQTSFVVDSCAIIRDPCGYFQPMKVHSFKGNFQ